MTGKISRGAQAVIFALLPAVLLFGVLEIIARFKVGPQDEILHPGQFRPLELPAPEVEKDGTAAYVSIRHSLRRARVAVPKAPGAMRAFSFGGSSTYGYPLTAEAAFPAQLERMMAARHPDLLFESYNFGSVCRDSYDIVRFAEYSLNFAPDIWIIYAGHNDFVNMQGNSLSLGWLKERPWTLDVLFSISRFWRTPAWINAARVDARDTRKFLTQQQPPIMPWEPFAREQQRIIDHLIANYQKVDELARRHGVTLIIALPASNIYDRAPFVAIHFGVTPAAVEEHDVLINKAFRAKQLGQIREVIELYRQAARLSPHFARTHFGLAKAFEQADEYRAMLHELTAARDLDVNAWRATTAMQEAQRRFARERRRAVIDVPRLLLAASPGYRVGCNFFGNKDYCDHVHPNVEAHHLIAEALAQEVEKVAGGAKPAD